MVHALEKKCSLGILGDCKRHDLLGLGESCLDLWSSHIFFCNIREKTKLMGLV